jgi:hypothetical protein
MSYLNRIWRDVKRGENIDAYLTIIVAIIVPLLNILGILPQSALAAITLAVLSLLAILSLGNRYRLEQILEAGHQSLDNVLLRKFPATLESDIEVAKDLWIMGSNLGSTVPTLYSVLENKLQRGDKVRVLVITPRSEASKLTITRVYRPIAQEQFDDVILSTLKLLQSLRQEDSKNLEVRTIDFPIAIGFFAINPESANGIIYLEHYSYKSTTDQIPKMILRPKDGYWYDFYKDQLVQIWNSSTDRGFS